MIISNSQITMAAKHDYYENHQVVETLQIGAAPPTINALIKAPDLAEQVDISTAGSLLALQRQRQTLDLATPLDSRSRINLMILAATYEAITGRKLELIGPGEMLQHEGLPQTLDVNANPPRIKMSTSAPILYERNEIHHEQEKSAFAAQGVVRTQDGREINFSVNLTMEREFIKESSRSIYVEGAPQKIDPLVINFDGLGASLSQTRFAFDLDSDGTEEQIATLRPGSGFLALDNNGDGLINNGSELFGPKTGRGFQELAQYDEDGNNFIDEADSIYQKLRIWTTHEDGSTQLVALGDKQVGAIFLGHVTTPFQLRDTNNNSLGEVAHSGVYLSEDGKVGIVQELYLTV